MAGLTYWFKMILKSILICENLKTEFIDRGCVATKLQLIHVLHLVMSFHVRDI